MNKVKTTKQVMKQTPVLRDLVNLLREHFGDRLEQVKLFGSYARGEQRTGGDADYNSDIDILVVLDKVTEADRDVVVDLIRDIMYYHELFISPHLYSHQEFERLNNPPSSFMQIISREAISI